MAQSVLADHPQLSLEVYIVWMPMVGGDSFETAARASTIFHDSRARQFYDENRLCGLAYAEQVFPNAYDEADRSLPPDHWLRQQLAGFRERPREERAFWDAVFFYGPGLEWIDRPPPPTHWLKQTSFFRPRSLFRRGPTGLFWRDSFTNPPFESDWFDALSEVMAGFSHPLQSSLR